MKKGGAMQWRRHGFLVVSKVLIALCAAPAPLEAKQDTPIALVRFNSVSTIRAEKRVNDILDLMTSREPLCDNGLYIFWPNDHVMQRVSLGQSCNPLSWDRQLSKGGGSSMQPISTADLKNRARLLRSTTPPPVLPLSSFGGQQSAPLTDEEVARIRRSIYDPAIQFEPFQNSRVAWSNDGQWLAVVGRSLSLQHDPLHRERPHYRVLLYRRPESARLADRYIEAFPLFDTADCLSDATNGIIPVPLDPSLGELPNLLLLQFLQSLTGLESGIPAELGWRPNFELQFNHDGSRLQLRIYYDEFERGEQSGGVFSNRPHAPGRRRDLGVHTTLAFDLSNLDILTKKAVTVEGLCYKVPTYRSIMPNSTYVDVNSVLNPRGHMGPKQKLRSWSLSPSQKYVALSQLRQVDPHHFEQALWIIGGDQLSSLKSLLDRGQAGGDEIWSGAINNHVSSSFLRMTPFGVMTRFYIPHIRWFDDEGKLLYRDSFESYAVVDLEDVWNAARRAQHEGHLSAAASLKIEPLYRSRGAQTFCDSRPLSEANRDFEKNYLRRFQPFEGFVGNNLLIFLDQKDYRGPNMGLHAGNLHTFDGNPLLLTYDSRTESAKIDHALGSVWARSHSLRRPFIDRDGIAYGLAKRYKNGCANAMRVVRFSVDRRKEQVYEELSQNGWAQSGDNFSSVTDYQLAPR